MAMSGGSGGNGYQGMIKRSFVGFCLSMTGSLS